MQEPNGSLLLSGREAVWSVSAGLRLRFRSPALAGPKIPGRSRRNRRKNRSQRNVRTMVERGVLRQRRHHPIPPRPDPPCLNRRRRSLPSSSGCRGPTRQIEPPLRKPSAEPASRHRLPPPPSWPRAGMTMTAFGNGLQRRSRNSGRRLPSRSPSSSPWRPRVIRSSPIGPSRSWEGEGRQPVRRSRLSKPASPQGRPSKSGSGLAGRLERSARRPRPPGRRSRSPQRTQTRGCLDWPARPSLLSPLDQPVALALPSAPTLRRQRRRHNRHPSADRYL